MKLSFILTCAFFSFVIVACGPSASEDAMKKQLDSIKAVTLLKEDSIKKAEKENLKREAEEEAKMEKCKCCGQKYDPDYGFSSNDLGWGYSRIYPEKGGAFCSKRCVQDCVSRYTGK